MHRLYPLFLGKPAAFGLLFLRVVAGLALMLHGWPKIQHAFSWMGPESWAPPFLQALAAVAEFGGGIALIAGLLTPIACLAIMCNMLVAIVSVHLAKGDPFVGKGSSYELASLYFSIATMLLCTGPGIFSIDANLFRKPVASNEPLKERAGAGLR